MFSPYSINSFSLNKGKKTYLYTNPVMLTHFALPFFRGSSMDLTLSRTVWK